MRFFVSGSSRIRTHVLLIRKRTPYPLPYLDPRTKLRQPQGCYQLQVPEYYICMQKFSEEMQKKGEGEKNTEVSIQYFLWTGILPEALESLCLQPIKGNLGLPRYPTCLNRPPVRAQCLVLRWSRCHQDVIEGYPPDRSLLRHRYSPVLSHCCDSSSI